LNLKTQITTSSRILMVDDEDSNVVVLERLLRQAGYANIHGTTDSRKAIPLYNQISPDIVFLDLHMPDPNGFDLLGHFSKQRPEEGAYVPLVVLTADVTPGTKLKALALGANDFLTKPFERCELLLRTRNLLETRFLYRELAAESERSEELRHRVSEAEASSRLLLEKLTRLGEYPELEDALRP
jgi:putative two-component system response regulator